MQKKVTKLEQRIKDIKAELMQLGDMRPGSLSTQCRSWGGRYCQLSYTHRGKGHTEYVQDEVKQQVEQQLQNYKKFRALTQEWIDKAIKLAKMRVDMQKAQNSKRRWKLGTLKYRLS